MKPESVAADAGKLRHRRRFPSEVRQNVVVGWAAELRAELQGRRTREKQTLDRWARVQDKFPWLRPPQMRD